MFSRLKSDSTRWSEPTSHIVHPFGETNVHGVLFFSADLKLRKTALRDGPPFLIVEIKRTHNGVKIYEA